jgi:hypothetical protein
VSISSFVQDTRPSWSPGDYNAHGRDFEKSVTMHQCKVDVGGVLVRSGVRLGARGSGRGR